MVTGILGKKVGTTQVFVEGGKVVPVTAIEAGPCVVTQIKSSEKEGYNAVQIGFGETKRLNKPEKGHLEKVGAYKHLREFRMSELAGVEIGQKVTVEMFQAGEKVDVVGTSKGRGFAGGVKRHGFQGGPKTHGQKDRHRAPGSIGGGTSPGKVWKGLRMAGHMGDERVTVRNLKVVQTNPDRNLILVEGAVPGARNGLVMIRKTKGGAPKAPVAKKEEAKK